MRNILFFLTAIAITQASFAQVYFEPFAGYQKDLNNKKFHLLNTGLQLSYVKGRRYEMILQLQKSWSAGYRNSDSSFTLNPNLPLYSPAAKLLRPSFISAAFGNRFKILGVHSRSQLQLKVFTGIVYQRISVNYQNDKTNYIVLNPDKTLQAVGIFLSGGLEYMRQLPSARLFAEINFSTPPATGKLEYPYSFNVMSPLTINLGYSILLKKK